MDYTTEEIEAFLADIYAGRITIEYLPEGLYFAIADYLKKAVYKGFNGSFKGIKFGGQRLRLFEELNENIYMFSGAKTYQQVRQMIELLTITKNFSHFKKEALKIYDEYNKSWLETEHTTAIGQAQSARIWNDIEETKDLFPYLKYSAVIDKNTSDICRPLDGMVRKVDDPLWSRYSPLNHFNCRCILQKVSVYDGIKETSEGKTKMITNELDDTVQKEFKMNPGKDGYIFSTKHPYFEVAPKDKGLAKENFGLPIPKKG